MEGVKIEDIIFLLSITDFTYLVLCRSYTLKKSLCLYLWSHLFRDD